MKTPWLLSASDGWILRVQVVPGSSKNSVVGPHGDRIRIKIAAPPVDGKANEGLVDFIAKRLELKTSAIELIRGHTSKQKDLLLRLKSTPEVQKKIASLLGLAIS